MLAKGKGPEYDFVVGGVVLLDVATGTGTFGTMLSEGQMTFGDRNWIFSLAGGSGVCGVDESSRDRLPSAPELDVP